MGRVTSKDVKIYTTTDINIVTALSVAGHAILDTEVDSNLRLRFKFARNEKLEDDLAKLRRNELVLPAASLLSEFRRIKSIIKDSQLEFYRSKVGANHRKGK